MWLTQSMTRTTATCSAAQSSGVSLSALRSWANKFWQAIPTLGRLHGSRLQIQVPERAFSMLEAEPMLAAHVSQASLPWDLHADAGSGLVDQVSSMSSVTRLNLPVLASVRGKPGMLDALRQLSALQSLLCVGTDMQTVLVNSVPRSWSLLTRLQVIRPEWGPGNKSVDWPLVEQQIPQLQALDTLRGVPLCLTALTCRNWPQDIDSFKCSRLGHLHVRGLVSANLLPSTLTSLSLDSIGKSAVLGNLQIQHLRSQQSLVHICFTSWLVNLSQIRQLVSGIHPVNSVTSVELTIQPQAFLPPHMDGFMTGQHFNHLGAWCPHLQRLHIHLQGKQQVQEVLISAA